MVLIILMAIKMLLILLAMVVEVGMKVVVMVGVTYNVSFVPRLAKLLLLVIL